MGKVVLQVGLETIIQCVLDFVNLEEIKSAGQVEGLFLKENIPRSHWNSLLNDPPAKAVEAFKSDQEKARRWLDQLEKTGSLQEADSQAVLEIFNRTFRLLAVGGWENGRYVISEVVPDLSGVEACIAFSVTALLNDYDLADKVKMCECGKYFIAWKKDTRFCSQRCATRERVRRWRKKE